MAWYLEHCDEWFDRHIHPIPHLGKRRGLHRIKKRQTKQAVPKKEWLKNKYKQSSLPLSNAKKDKEKEEKEDEGDDDDHGWYRVCRF